MTLKNMFMLGSVLAGAAYLQDKGRRDRVFGQARGLIDRAKSRASEIAGQIQSRTGQSTATTGDNGVSSSYGNQSSYSGVGGSSATGSSIGGTSGFGGSGTYR